MVRSRRALRAKMELLTNTVSSACPIAEIVTSVLTEDVLSQIFFEIPWNLSLLVPSQVHH